jgi:hypothetical protein
VSKIYPRTDNNHLAKQAIAAALFKMTRSKQNPFNDAFDELNEGMLLHFTKRDSRSIHWCHMGQLEGNGEWSKYANPKKYLYAIDDLGRGSDGQMWLTLFRCCLCIEIPYHQRWELPIQGHRR